MKESNVMKKTPNTVEEETMCIRKCKNQQSGGFISPFSITVVMLLAFALLGKVNGQVVCDPNACKHAIDSPTGAFGTNCHLPNPQLVSTVHAGDFVALTVSAEYADHCGNGGDDSPFSKGCFDGDRSVVTNIFLYSTNNSCLPNFNTGNLLNTIGVDPTNLVGGKYPVLSFPGYQQYNNVTVTNGFYNQVSYVIQIPFGCSGKVTFRGHVDAYDTNTSPNDINFNIGNNLNAEAAKDIIVISPKLCVTKTCQTNGQCGEDQVISWTGTITNCGIGVVSNIVVKDYFNVDPAGHTSGEQVTNILFLNPGQARALPAVISQAV